MGKLDKNITDNFDLNMPVCINSTKSYRDGNLMWLDFSVVDKDKNHICSIAGEFSRDESDLSEIVSCIFNLDVTKKRNMDFLAFELYSFAITHKWYPGLEYTKVSKKIDAEMMEELFIYLWTIPYVIQKTIAENNFFDLQTKEEYEAKEKDISDMMDKLDTEMVRLFESEKEEENQVGVYMAKKLFSEALVISTEFEESIGKNFKALDAEVTSWICDSSMKMLFDFGRRHGIELNFRDDSETAEKKMMS